jgi:hypothetical protein
MCSLAQQLSKATALNIRVREPGLSLGPTAEVEFYFSNAVVSDDVEDGDRSASQEGMLTLNVSGEPDLSILIPQLGSHISFDNLLSLTIRIDDGAIADSRHWEAMFLHLPALVEVDIRVLDDVLNVEFSPLLGLYHLTVEQHQLQGYIRPLPKLKDLKVTAEFGEFGSAETVQKILQDRAEAESTRLESLRIDIIDRNQTPQPQFLIEFREKLEPLVGSLEILVDGRISLIYGPPPSDSTEYASQSDSSRDSAV